MEGLKGGKACSDQLATEHIAQDSSNNLENDNDDQNSHVLREGYVDGTRRIAGKKGLTIIRRGLHLKAAPRNPAIAMAMVTKPATSVTAATITILFPARNSKNRGLVTNK